MKFAIMIAGAVAVALLSAGAFTAPALAVVLAIAVAGGSAFYARQSRLQARRTLAALG